MTTNSESQKGRQEFGKFLFDEMIRAWREKEAGCFLPDGSRNMGTPMRAKFWRGFDGDELNRNKGTLGDVCWKAGKAARIERDDDAAARVGSRMVMLKSVGSYFHTSTLMTYPVQTDGGFDPDDGVHIDDIMECCEEWFEGLSDFDRKMIWSAVGGLVELERE